MNPKFSLDKLSRTMRSEIRDITRDKARFFKVTCRFSGTQFICGHGKDLLQHVRTMQGRNQMDKHEEISDDADQAMKLLEIDNVRAWDLLKEVANHVEAGHYNTWIIEQLRAICEIEKLHTAEAILASVPPRESNGIVEGWCVHAICLYRDMRLRILTAKRDLQERIIQGK